MDSDEFEKQMRALEWFHAFRCLPGAWVVLRLDGRGFTKFIEREGFERPFDFKFQGLMRQTAQVLLEELQGIYAYTESDEISLLFQHPYQSPQQELWEIGAVEWFVIIRTDPPLRRRRRKSRLVVVQLPLLPDGTEG
jgi:tRNAHis guanylyltransferase